MTQRAVLLWLITGLEVEATAEAGVHTRVIMDGAMAGNVVAATAHIRITMVIATVGAEAVVQCTSNHHQEGDHLQWIILLEAPSIHLHHNGLHQRIMWRRENINLITCKVRGGIDPFHCTGTRVSVLLTTIMMLKAWFPMALHSDKILRITMVKKKRKA